MQTNSISLLFIGRDARTPAWSPMAMNVVLVLLLVVVGVVVEIRNFTVLKLFPISQPIVVKLRTQIDDNIIHNRIVSDFQVKS